MKKFNMKKTTAAAVAAAVGAALLLGGAGTLAYWSDSVESDAQTIASGSLDLGSLDETEGWTVSNGAVVNAAFGGTIVPGDTLSRTIYVPVTLSGQNLEATLNVATPLVDPTVPVSNPALADELEIAVASVGGTNGATKTFTASNPSVPVVITVEFPFGSDDSSELTDLLNTESKQVHFTSTYTLTQVAKS